MSTKRVLRALGSLLVSVGLMACAAAPVPAARVAAAKAAIRASQEVGAENSPRAALHLRLAQDEYRQARQLIRREDNERASVLLMRAEADAELALTLARARATAQDADRAATQLGILVRGEE